MTGVVGRLFKEFAVTLSVVGDRLRRRVADPDADDVRPAAAACASRNIPATCRARWTRRLQRLAGVATGVSLRLGVPASGAWCCWSALATLVGTIWLYIIVPKGFLPQQDTGVILARDRGRAEHLDPRACSSCRTEAAEIAARDPAVDRCGVVRRRRHDQRHAEHRAADHRAEAGRPARSGA